MAIKILSKDIYDLDNNKLKNNKINGVDYEENDCGFVTDYRQLVDNIKIQNFTSKETLTETGDSHFSHEISGSSPSFPKYVTYDVSLTIQALYTTGTITIPINKGKDKILRIYDKKDVNGNSNIRYSINGELRTIIDTEFEQKDTTTDYVGDLEDLTYNVPIYYNHGNLGKIYLGTASLTAESITNLGTLTVRTDENKTNFYIDYQVPYIVRKVALINKREYTNPQENFGESLEYTAKEIEITVYGDVYKFNIETGKVTIGENPNITLDSNELMQKDTGVIETESDGSIYINPIGNWLSEKIIGDYNNGKETAELLCQIGEYYYENDTLAISTKVADKPMTFEINNVVIPHIYNSQGQDVPMSINKDGTAKQFRVTGVDFIYDGAVWQKLTLQEV